MTRFARIATLVAAIGALPLGLAAAQADEPLPGVSGDHQIVKPLLPEPEDGASADKDAIKIGDWDVRISGYVRVDVGVGKIRPSQR